MVNEMKKILKEGVGYVYCDFFSGRDYRGYEHFETWFCIINSKDSGEIDLGWLLSQFFGVECNFCGMINEGYPCEEELKDEECPYRDESGICKPPLFKFKISVDKRRFIIEAEPLKTPLKLKEPKKITNTETSTLEQGTVSEKIDRASHNHITYMKYGESQKARCVSCIHLEKIDEARYRCPINKNLPEPHTLPPHFGRYCILYSPRNESKSDKLSITS